MSQIVYSMKQAYLSLKQKPGFVMSVVTTIGLTMGALLCVVTLAYVVLIKPLPYPEQEKLYIVESKIQGDARAPKMSMYPYPAFVMLYKQLNKPQQNKKQNISNSENKREIKGERETQTPLNLVSMITYENANITSIASHPRVNTTYITPEYLTLLDMPLAMGRYFDQSETLNTHKPVAIISFKTWKNLYHQQADIIGQTIRVNTTSFNIIGVANENFSEPALYEVGRETQIWLPWDFNPVPERGRNGWGHFAPNLFMLSQINNEFNPYQAEQLLTPQLNTRWKQELVGNARFKDLSLSIKLRSIVDVVSGDNNTGIFLLLSAVIGLLIMTFTNISHLFVARGAEQQHQAAIRVALGAKKKQLFNHMLTEITCLMALSVCFAVAVANAGFYLSQHYLTDLFNRVDELQLSLPPLLVILFIVTLITLMFAKLNITGINFNKIQTKLQSGNKNQAAQVSSRFQKVIITSQILLTVLIIFANIVLFKESFTAITKTTGFNFENIQQLKLAYNDPQQASSEERLNVLRQIKAQLHLLPETTQVSQGSSPITKFSTRIFSINANDQEVSLRQNFIDEQYFSMMNQTLHSGRTFSKSEINDREDLIIVNESFARQLTEHGEVIGQKIKTSRDVLLTIIGVVNDIHVPNREANLQRIYRPVTIERDFNFMIKHKNQNKLTREQIVQLLNGIDPRFSVFSYENLTKLHTGLQLNNIVTVITTAIVTILVLIVAGIGLFGVLDFSTRMRRFEIGTRMAIGAKGKDIVALIFKDNSGLLLLGIVTSLLVLLSLSIGYSTELKHYLSWQLLPILLATLGLVSIVSFCACYLPLRQYINRPAIHSLKGS